MKTNTINKALYSLLLIGILLNTQPAFSYTFNGYEVNDLINVDLTDEIKSWTASRAINSQALSTSIGGKNFLGGPNVLGTATTSSGDSFSRTYKTLPKHNLITFQFTLSVCGAWSDDIIKASFDGVPVDNLKFNQKNFVAGVCGSTAGLSDITVSGRIAHNMNTLTFKLASAITKPSSQVSFGIRDFSFICATVATTAVKTDVCCSSSTSSALAWNQCSCTPGSYAITTALTGSTTKCATGSPLCDTCFGASAAECYSCKMGTYFDGKNCVACHNACAACTGAGPSKCTVLKQTCIEDCNGNCVASCPAPLTLDATSKLCSSECSLEQWIYPDGSCQPSCSGDLVQVTIGCYKLCTSPCKVGFLTCEGTCQTSCVAPAQNRDTNGICYCDWPCPQGEYYWQESKLTPCTEDCPLPWECGTDSKTGIPICQPKCDPDGKLYVWVAEENRCDCECPSGYSVQKVKGLYTCLPICSCDEVFWAEGGEGQNCLNKCPDGWATKTDPYGNQYCDRICCAGGPDQIFFNGQCVCECPPGWQTLMINKVPMCVPLCDCGQYWWEEGCVGGVGSCMDKCPDAWVEGKDCNGLDICQRQCCDGDKDIWFKEEGQCVCDCPDGWVKAKINEAWTCVEACECDEFWWQGSEYKASCVDKCPEGWKCDKGCADVDICSPQCCADAPENIWFGAKGECVCECPTGWLVKDVNGVPQCAHACECGDVWWQECPPAGVCLDKCPQGWQWIQGCEGVDLCAPQCPCDSLENTWFPAAQKCVCECPPAWISSTVNGLLQCVPACGCEEYWWYEGGDNGACVSECPDGWQCDTGCEGAKICSPKCKPTDTENIWFSEKGACVCECPPGWVPQEVSGGLQCVKACKQGEFWWQECNGEGACVCDCPEGWKCDQGCENVDICSPQCCADASENIWFGAKGDCVCECPPAWTSEKVNDVWQCVPTCEKDLYWWCEGGDNGACVCECPVGWKCDTGCEGIPICSPICSPTDTQNIFFPETDQCVCECPDGFVSQEINGGLQCVEVCPKGEFWWQGCDGKESCVCDCPEGWKCDKGCAGVDICTPQCSADGPGDTWLGPEKICVCECPAGYSKDFVNDVWQCVPICECDQIWWSDGGSNGACVDKCPVGWQCAPGCGDIEICVPDCDCSSPENIWFDAKGVCVCECPPGWVKAEVNSVPQCTLSCECGDYWWQECGSEGACVEKCPDGWKCDKGCENVDICTPQCCADAPENIWSVAQGRCVCECCDGWVAQEVNGVLQCVEVCQCDQIWWGDGAVGGACVDKCPDGWKCDKGCEGIDICVPLCPCDIDNIWFADKNECVCECPAGWVKAEINNVPQCVHACQCGEYWWQDCGNEGACVCECPEGWKTDKGCEYVDLCSPQCDYNAPENIWLASEQKCVCQCPDGYYKTQVNGLWQCVPICEPGLYWWSEGNACVCECPLGWSWGSGCGGIDICVPVCDLTCDNNCFFELKDECIPYCPPGTGVAIVNYVPICVNICPEGELWWCEGADNGACVCECPLGWVAGEGPGGIPICNRQCDADSVDNVWFNEKGICTCECPQGWTVDTINEALVCSHLCPDNELWWQAGGVDGACVCDCPENWVPSTGCDGVGICIPQCDQTSAKSILLNGDCACECPCGWISVKVNDLPVCKTLCPQGQYWWELASECVCQCPDGYKCDKDPYGADVCVPQCDLSTPEIYWSPADGKCVCDCPTGTSINTVNKVLTCVPYCNEIF